MGKDSGGAMSNLSSVPEFGARKPGQQYVPRPGAYAILTDGQGRIAVMQTPRGCYLPGGGSEGGETPEETLLREIREECGFHVAIIGKVGEAVEYVHTLGNEFGIRKECVFFAATVSETCGRATEDDHVLIWLEPHEAEHRLAHGSQRWAVCQRETIETVKECRCSPQAEGFPQRDEGVIAWKEQPAPS